MKLKTPYTNTFWLVEDIIVGPGRGKQYGLYEFRQLMGRTEMITWSGPASRSFMPFRTLDKWRSTRVNPTEVSNMTELLVHYKEILAYVGNAEHECTTTL